MIAEGVSIVLAVGLMTFSIVMVMSTYITYVRSSVDITRLCSAIMFAGSLISAAILVGVMIHS